ncbi:hypothetical protein F0251_22780 [Vibrio sp. 070316B]|uniref:hypothetical protein n=1 Tax=Vibrio sp. 070316B TaxID=2607608 RepID=UPI0014933FF0|nr:hypothetical protein [Vibrio sp. 070316B]NOI41236.1 hypothetical protein [Vibrio sp. 070316B]CAH7063836.1 conserved membrane hypothetical protein [Vibrio chagasii]
MDFFDETWVQVVSYCMPFFIILGAYLAQKQLEKLLNGDALKSYKKLMRDSLVKTFLMFLGSILLAGLVFASNGNLTDSMTKSLFSLSCLVGLNLIWQNKKNSEIIQEAKSISLEGERQKRLEVIEMVHKKAAGYYAKVSIIWGGMGIVYSWFLYDSYPLNFMWFIAVLSTSPALIASRWSDAVTYAATKFANDKELCS